jgi:hypothetical protein
MRKLLVLLCSVGLTLPLSAIEMPKNSPPHKVSLLSGAVLRDDIDTQRTLHFQHGVEYSYSLTPDFFLASQASFNMDRNFQGRHSYLEENLYALHFLAYASFTYLLRFSVGIGPSLRAGKSILGIQKEEVYGIWQYGLGGIGSVKVDYAISPQWELGYTGSYEMRLPEPRTTWRRDVSHLLGLGYRL